MKKQLPRSFAILFMVLALSWPCPYAFALPDVVFTAGLKVWHNEWVYNGDVGRDFKDSSFLVGPSFKLSAGRFFTGLTYMSSTADYDLSWRYYVMETPRTDIDLVAGYQLGPNISIFSGYKYITYAPNMYKDQEWLSQGENSVNAWLAGVALFKTMSRKGVTLNGSLAGGVYDAHSSYNIIAGLEPGEQDPILLRFGDKGEIYSGELGVTLPYSEKTYINFSYKYQLLDSDVDTSMVFKGFLFSVDFVF
jgi:hypothetical protein